jgi:O-acetylserine/cysteine efflux transporter
MKPRDIALAVSVAVVWGLAFLVSKVGLRELSPLTLTALRFVFAAVPCLVVPRPRLSWALLIGISATWFVGQFVAQFYGLAHGVPAGLTAVIVQSQALFTVALAALVFGEIPNRMQLVGIAIAVLGLALICATVGYDFSVGAFLVTLLAPVCFAAGNLLLRRARGVSMFDLVAWLSALVPLPLLVMACIADGVDVTLQSLIHLSWTGIAVGIVLGVVSTTFAYWTWAHLLQRYTAAQVVPFALLVPVVASVASMIAFGERFSALRLSGMATLVVGVAVMLVLGRPRATPQMAQTGLS